MPKRSTNQLSLSTPSYWHFVFHMQGTLALTTLNRKRHMISLALNPHFSLASRHVLRQLPPNSKLSPLGTTNGYQWILLLSTLVHVDAG